MQCAKSPPRVGDTYVEAGSKSSRWRLREISRDVCVLDRIAEPNRSRYIYLKHLLRLNRYANEKDLAED
jgi:hypothetical protein